MGCGRQSLPPPARQSRICVASLRCSSVKYVEYSPSSRLGPSEAECREAAKLRLEGKEHVVADGDVINFRFNV
jgi:ribosome-binding ATPase YchF (GTP1/OBG family)